MQLCNYLFAFLLLRWFHPDSWFTKKGHPYTDASHIFFNQQFRPLWRNLALYIQLLYLHMFMNLSKYMKHSLFCIYQTCWLCSFNSMKKVGCRWPGWNPQLPQFSLKPPCLLIFSHLTENSFILHSKYTQNISCGLISVDAVSTIQSLPSDWVP